MRRLLLAAALLVEALALAFIAWRGDPAVHAGALAVAWIAAVSSALVALAMLRTVHLRLRVIVLAGLALRLALLPAEPTLSDDVWRYLHDGRAQLAGVSPYAFAPADDATLSFRGAEHPRINHPHLVTIYPPAAQLAFALAALPGPSLPGWKLLLLLAELALVLALAGVLRARQRDPRLVALYAWHPLAALEIAANAHLEPIALAPLMIAFAYAARRRAAAAGVFGAISIAAKYWALPLLPFLARDRPVVPLFAAAGALAVLYAPYLAAGANPFGSAGIFMRDWLSNPGAFALLLFATGSRTIALVVVASALVTLLAVLWMRGARAEDAAFAFVFATLLLAPVVHPWYVVWLAALLPAARMPPFVIAAAAWWTVTAPAAYAVLPVYAATGVWRVPLWAVMLQLAPVALLLAAALVTAASSRFPQRAALPAP